MTGKRATQGIERTTRTRLKQHDEYELFPMRPEARCEVQEFSVKAEPESVSDLRVAIDSMILKAGARGADYFDLKIAVGEALSNSFRHGSPNPSTDTISVRLTHCTSAIIIEITDRGRPFEPNNVPTPCPELMPEGGMGIFLMRQVMDVVTFKCTPKGNSVTLVKWLEEKDFIKCSCAKRFAQLAFQDHRQ